MTKIPDITTCASTASSVKPEELTLEKLKEAVDLLKKFEDPLVKFMKEQGFDPSRGDLMVLPVDAKNANWGRFGPPNFIQFSRATQTPVLVKGFKP